MTDKCLYPSDDERFIAIVKNARNISQALKELGLAQKGANYQVLRKRCISLGITPPPTRSFKERNIRKTKTDADVIASCKEGMGYASTLRRLGLSGSAKSNTNWIKKKIKELSIDTSHWTGQGHLKNKTHNWSKIIPLEKILVKNSSYTCMDQLKKRLLKQGFITNECNRCKIVDWQGESLSLHLDHINGDRQDNRLENLRLLCPNCHSLTPTYCGKNKGKY